MKKGSKLGTLAKAPSSISRHRAGWYLCVFAVLLVSGCLSATTRPATFKESYQSAPASKSTPTGAKTEEKVGKSRSVGTKHATTRPHKASGSGRKTAARKRTKGPDAALKKRLQNAARQLAKSLGSVRRMKLCYDERADEWWLTLYKELSTAIDVKQFFWSWEREEFTPFLVIKRISKSKLMEDLKKRQPGRRCKELSDPPVDPNDPFEKFWGRNPEFKSR